MKKILIICLLLVTSTFSQQIMMKEKENISANVYVGITERLANDDLSEQFGIDFIKKFAKITQRSSFGNMYQGYIMDGVSNDSVIEINLYLQSYMLYSKTDLLIRYQDDLLVEHSQIYSVAMLKPFTSALGITALKYFLEDNPSVLELFAKKDNKSVEEYQEYLDSIPKIIFKFGFLDEERYILVEYDIFKDYVYPKQFKHRLIKMVNSMHNYR
ncbi:MAG: hypothetical protein ACOC33_02600 [bacterium]